MTIIRMLGIVLLVAGGLVLAYGGFTYTTDTHEAMLGPIQLSVQERETFVVPIWVGIVSIVAGAVLLFVRK